MRATLVVLTGCLACAGSAQILADTFSGFSGLQDQGGWTYRFYDRTADATPDSYDFQTEAQLMPEFNSNDQKWYVQKGTFWTMLGLASAHGNGSVTSGGRTPNEQMAIRRWTSNYTGQVKISTSVAKISTGGGNGVTAWLYVNGTPKQSQWIAGNDWEGSSFEVETVLNTGDAVEWWLDPTQADDLFDLSTLSGTVTAVPEPAVLAALGIGLAAMLRKRRQ